MTTTLSYATPIRELIAESDIPSDIFTSPDGALSSILDKVYFTDLSVASGADSLGVSMQLVIAGEAAISFPGVEGLALVFGSDGAGATLIDFSLLLTERGVSARLDNVSVALRFPPSVLKPVPETPGGPTPPYAQISVTGSIILDEDLNLRFEGFDNLSLSPVMIGDSGVVISADNIKLDFSRTETLPEIEAAGFDESFMGVYIGEARIRLPEGLPDLAPEDLVLREAAIGSGGVSGWLEAHYSPTYDAAAKTFSGRGSGDLFGIPFGLGDVGIRFKQNALTESRITGKLLLPFFDEPVDVEIAINLSGGFDVRIASSDGLFTLTKDGLLSFSLDSIGFGLDNGVFAARLSGKLTPLFGAPGLEWPTFTIRELSIDSEGNVKLDGGWLDLPDQYVLSLYGFQLSISQIGFGKSDDGGNWIGFSGGLKLVDGLSAGASVEGLRVTWYDDGRDPAITLSGVGVEFEIPGAVRFKGEVSYREFELDAEMVRRFDGAIKLELISLDLTIDAVLVIGVASGPQGDYTFFAIYLGVELPAGIPLWSTGIALYGLAGLFALQMEPDKRTDEPWYGIGAGEGWYKRPEIGVTDLKRKWKNKRDSLALGAGITLGTVPDNGFTFSAKTLFAIVFPGPILLIEGKANLLRERSSLSDEPLFRALAVLDAQAGTFLVGIDIRYRYGSGGELIDIGGGTEAFFDFNNPMNWHLYLGLKETRDKRIRAQILSLFEANAYFMLDAQQLAMGAWVGWDVDWNFGPLSVDLEAWIEGNVVVSWKPLHFYGDLWLHGKVELSVFGFGLGLTVDARIEADVFDPFHLLGEFSVGINLPWPLPDFDVSITLEWGPTPTPPPLPLPLKEVAVEHFKATTSWPLPRGQWLLPNYDSDNDGFHGAAAGASVPGDLPGVPVVPVDARPHVTFGRAVHDDALVGVNAQPATPAWERVGDPAKNEGPVRIRYGLKEMALERRNPSGGAWELVARKGSTANPAGVKTLYGSWAPVPALPSGAVAPSTDPPTANIKLWLWSRTPFDYTRHTGGAWEEWFTDRFEDYPCIPPPPDRTICCDFEDLPAGQPPSFPYACSDHPEMVFVGNRRGGSHRIVALVPPAHGKSRALCFDAKDWLGVALRMPAKNARITLAPREHQRTRSCADFRERHATTERNPLEEQGFKFEARDHTGQPMPSNRIMTMGGARGLDCAYELLITLPGPATSVELSLTHFARQARIEALDTSGSVVDATAMAADGGQTETVIVSGDGIVAVRVTAPSDETLLHRICADTLTTPGVTAVGIDSSGQQHGPFSPYGDVIDVPVNDLVGVRIHGTGETCVVEVCANIGPDPGEARAREEMAQHLVDEMARWSQEGEVLEPHTTYRVKVVTTIEAQGEGGLSGYAQNHEMTEYAYFQTDGPPGLTQLSVPVNHPSADDFESGLDDLMLYVRQTVPATVPPPGELPSLPRPVYRAYDVGVEFNEDYVDLMYRLERRDLGLYLYDSNNQPVRDAQGRLIVLSNRWGETETLTLSRSEDVWVRMIDASRCVALDESTIPHDKTLTASEEGQVLDPDIVYEARLIPLLLHEDFGKPAVGTIANGPAGTLDGWTVRDDGTNGGPSRWEVIQEGTPPSRHLVQTANTWGGTVDGPDPVKPGTMLLRADNPGLPAGNTDQPGNWTDYRFSVFVRSADDDAIGVVFRYQGPANFYRFSMDRERRYRRLVRVVSGTHTVLAEDDFVYQRDTDYLITVEAIGPSLRVYQDGVPVFAVEDATFDHGRLGLYAWASEGARFTDVRVDDYRQSAPAVYRFQFTTSNFATFFHQIHSFQDETWRVDLDANAAPPSAGDIAALVGAAVVPGAAATDAERRAYETFAHHVLGESARQQPPELRVTRVEKGADSLGFLVESPEPIDWSRTDISLSRAARRVPMGMPPGDVKLTEVVFGTVQPNEESVDLLLRRPTDVTGHRIELRRLPGPLAEPPTDPVLFLDRFETDAGILFREAFGPNALDHYEVVDEGTNSAPSLWTVSGGHIVQSSNIYGGSVSAAVVDKPGTMALTGKADWRNVRITATLRAEDNDAIGVVLRHQDADNYYRFSMDRERSYRRFVKKVGGAFTVLWEDSVQYQMSRSHVLTIEAYEGTLVGYLDNAMLFAAEDEDIGSGRVGFYCWALQGAHFEGLEIEALETNPLLWQLSPEDLSGMEVFDAPGAISGPSEWAFQGEELVQTSNIHVNVPGASRPGTNLVGGDPAWGDIQLSVRLRSTDDDGIGVVFRYQDEDNYYRFSMDRERSYRRLVKKVGGTVTVLWQDTVQYIVGRTYELSIIARGTALHGYLDGTLLFTVHDAAFRRGLVGLYSWANVGARFERVVVTDRTRRVGGWTVTDEGTISAPSVWRLRNGALVQSANIHGGGATAYPGTFVVAGDPAWTDYRLSVRLRSDDDDAIGVMFRYQDEDNYYRLSMDAQANYRRLVRKRNGVFTTLRERTAGFRPGEWFTLTVDVVGPRMTAYMDGDLLFEAQDFALESGRVGLYCWGNDGARFDEVRVAEPSLEARALLKDRFREGNFTGWTVVDEGTVSAPSQWTFIGGALRQMRNIHAPPVDRGTLSKHGTHAVAGNALWRDYVLQVRMESHDNDAMGVIFRYQDTNNYYRFSMDRERGYRRLVKNVGGVFTLLWEDDVAYETGHVYEVTIVARGSVLEGFVDGVPTFIVEDGDIASGRIGLYCWANEDTRFHRVRVYPIDAAHSRWLFRDTFAYLIPDRWTFVDEGNRQGPSQWAVTAGELLQSSNIYGAVPGAPLDRPGTYALAGNASWSDFRLVVRLRSDDDDDIGVMFRYQDADNYYRFAMDRDNSFRRLTRKVGGVVTSLWQDGTRYVQGREYILTIDCVGDRVTGYLDGVRLFSVEDGDLATGRIGLYCRANVGARFSEVRVGEPAWTSYYTFGEEEARPAGTQVRVFAGNETDPWPAEAHVLTRFIAQLGESGLLRLPPDGADMRIVSPDGELVHARHFLPDGQYTPVTFKLLRKADGTGLAAFVPDGGAAGTALPQGEYRMSLTYRRDNRATAPESQVLSHGGDSSPEEVVIDIIGRRSCSPVSCQP